MASSECFYSRDLILSNSFVLVGDTSLSGSFFYRVGNPIDLTSLDGLSINPSTAPLRAASREKRKERMKERKGGKKESQEKGKKEKEKRRE